MSDINQLHTQYNQIEQNIAELETKIEEAKQRKIAVATDIKTQFGPGPHTVEGATFVVASARGGTTYLRAPLQRKSKQTVDASPEVEATEAAAE